VEIKGTSCRIACHDSLVFALNCSRVASAHNLTTSKSVDEHFKNVLIWIKSNEQHTVSERVRGSPDDKQERG
jgi:hypothetical protein